MRPHGVVAVILAGVFVAAAQPARAQIGFGVAGLYASLNGSDFDGTDAGIGVDGQVRFSIGGSGSLGIGGQYTRHGIQGISDNLKVLGVFGEPRYYFSVPGSLKPYLAGRAGYLRESISSGGIDASANGYLVGGGAGLLVNAAPLLHLDLTVLFIGVSFGDTTIDGTKVPDSSSHGSALALRIGVLFGK
jgi:hypothetical protein